MSLEAALAANTEAVLKLTEALAANDDRPAFVKNAAAAAGVAENPDAPKKPGRKPKAESLTGTDKVADPLEHPAFKAMAADVHKLVDINKASTQDGAKAMLEICTAYGVQKISHLQPAAWAEAHERIKAAIVTLSQPPAAAPPAAVSSFV